MAIVMLRTNFPKSEHSILMDLVLKNGTLSCCVRLRLITACVYYESIFG